jgi:hypothetical protein
MQLKKMGSSKNGKPTKQYLPQPVEKVWAQFQTLFLLPTNLTPEGKSWMTLENWGSYNKKTYIEGDYSTYTWNLDHINPHANFHYENMKCQEFRDCWDITNLRPLPAKQNIEEGDNRTPEQIAAIKQEIQVFLTIYKDRAA